MKDKTKVDPFLEWFGRFNLGLELLSNPGTFLAPPPAGPVTADTLAMLLQVRERLGVRDGDAAPALEAGRRMSATLSNLARSDALADLTTMLAAGLDDLIGNLLAAGHSDDSVIRAADFGELKPLALPAAEITNAGTVADVLLVCGIVATLPEGHRLATVLELASFYLHDGQNPSSACLVLGRAAGHGQARAFYPLQDALQFTRVYRTRQLERDRVRREEEEREALQQRRQFWNSDLGTLERKRRALDRLAAADKLPPEVIEQPVIRTGKG